MESTSGSNRVASDSRNAKDIIRQRPGPHAKPKGIQPPPHSPTLTQLNCRFFQLRTVGTCAGYISVVNPVDKQRTCTFACRLDAKQEPETRS